MKFRSVIKVKNVKKYFNDSWINWLLMQLLLFLLPAWASWRTHSYEVERWADSDHPKSTSSGDDDDDD